MMKRILSIAGWGILSYLLAMGTVCAFTLVYFFIRGLQGKPTVPDTQTLYIIGGSIAFAPIIIGLCGTLYACRRMPPRTTRPPCES